MHLSKNTVSRLTAHTIILMWAVAAYVFFQSSYSYTFFYKEQNQLFLLSSEHVSGYLSRQAWLSNLTGDFLTQFYYYLYAGPVIYAFLILLTGIISYLALRRLGLPRFVSCLIASAAEVLLTIFNFDPDYKTSAALSLTGTAFVLLLWTGFTECGFWSKNVGAMACPRPSLSNVGAGRVPARILGRVPARILGCVLVRTVTGVVFAAAAWWMFGLGLPSIGRLSTPYHQLEDYLEADCLYYFGKDAELSEKVESMKKDEVTGVISAYYYMSKSRLGMLPQSIGKVSPVNLGTLFHIGPKSSVQEIKLMAEFYFLLGDMTMTERAAMIALVSSPGNRNVRMIKRLAEANLVAGDDLAAKKYLAILEKTFAYRKWAKSNSNGHLNSKLRTKREYVTNNDRLRTDDNCRIVLLGLLDANPHNKVALDYLMCTDIQVGDLTLLHEDYEKYYLPYYGEAKEKLYRTYLHH